MPQRDLDLQRLIVPYIFMAYLGQLFATSTRPSGFEILIENPLIIRYPELALALRNDVILWSMDSR